MQNARLCLDGTASALSRRMGKASLPPSKARRVGSCGVTMPSSSSSSSITPLVQSITSSSSARETITRAMASSKTDSSPSSNGQGHIWTLAPAPQWREELSDQYLRDSSSSLQPSAAYQEQLLQTSTEGLKDRGQGSIGIKQEELRKTGTRSGRQEQKKLHRREEPQRKEAGQEPSSSDVSQGRQERNGAEAAASWRPDNDFKAAVELNRNISATLSAEEVLLLVEEHGESFTSVNAATAFHRIAKFGQHLSGAEQAVLRADPRTEQLAALVEAKWEEWGGRATNNIAWAHTVLGHGSPSLLSKVEARLPAQLPRMKPNELSIILWAFAKAGYASPESYAAAVPWLLARKSEWTIQTITMITWSYATAAPHRQDLFAALSREVMIQPKSVNVRALSTLAWGCARANHYDEEMFDKVAAWVAANWEHIPAFDLGNFAWGLGKAYGEHGVLSKGCMLAEDERRPAILRFINAMPIRLQALQAIRAAAMQQMPQLEVRAISNIAYGFACVHFWDGPLMDACAQRVMEQTTEINGQSLAILLWAFSTLRHEHAGLMEALAHRGLQLLQDPQEHSLLTKSILTMTIWAFANMGNMTATSQELLERLAEEACSRREIHEKLPTVAWALTVAGCLPDSLLRKIRGHMESFRQLDDMMLSQLYLVELAMRVKEAKSQMPQAQDQAPIRADNLFREWYQMGKLRQKSAKYWKMLLAHGKRHFTGIHKEVARIVSSLGGVYVLECDTGEWSVDIGFPDHKIAIEVDGPTHFTNNTLRPLGPTLLKRRLLAARGWDVVPVPYFHWSQLSGEYERQLYVFSALQSNSKGIMLVEAPVEPFNMDGVALVTAHTKIAAMLELETSPSARLAAPFRAALASPASVEVLQLPSMGASSATTTLPAVDAGSTDDAPSAEEQFSSGSDIDEGGHAKVASVLESGAGERGSRAALESRGGRTALLKYKQGRLSKQGLLMKIATAKAAAASHADSDGTDGSVSPSATEDNDSGQ